MPRLSLTLRKAIFAEESDEMAIVLVTIDHPDWDKTQRLSSHPTERLDTDPLTYGTVSNGENYYFALMSALLPDKNIDAPPTTSLIFENVTTDLVSLIKETDTGATVSMALVLASSPDSIEEYYSGLEVTSATATEDKITVEIGRVPVITEPSPCDHFTASRFPGLFR
jgi:hypothetical protein